ncbi:MAG: ComF family protein [Nitrospirota bacterium]|nr:ComF family protein [Nitrospirota bacterium]
MCGCMVRLLKYREKTALAGHLVRRIDLAAVPSGFWDVDLIVPVPLHASRLRQRGFNQSARVAAALAARLGVPLAVEALWRTVDTPSQVGMRRRQRLRNVARAFSVPEAERVEGKNILLVDDVITTGATLNACARALRRAGAIRVHAWAVARQAIR